MEPKFKEVRDQCAVFDQYAYMLTGETGPIPRFVYDGLDGYLARRFFVGGDASFDGRGTFTMIADTREIFAQLLGCHADDIAFGTNTSAMFSIFAEGFAFEPGDNVVMSADSFSSMKFAFEALASEGLEIRFAPAEAGVLTTEKLLSLVDARTRAVTVCHVESRTAFRHDVKAIGAFCRDKGIWFAVDAAHTVGVLPVDVHDMHIDFLCGNDYKWMLNFCGTGFAYVSPALREHLTHRRAGWLSMRPLFGPDAAPSATASKYELGYPFAPGIYTMGLVAQKYLELGREDVEAAVYVLGDYMIDKARATDGVSVAGDYPRANRSAMTMLGVPAKWGVTGARLKELGVQTTVYGTADPDGTTLLRVACHYMNNTSDIDRLFWAMEVIRSI